MAYSGDPYPPYDPTNDPIRDPAYVNAPNPPPYYARERDLDRRRDRDLEITRDVEAGPFRFGLREGLIGTIGMFAILGLVLGILGFAAAFALDGALDATRDGNPANDDAEAAAAALPAFLVTVLPFLAAPVLALGLGSWAGHASRRAGIGSIAGAIGCFVGPIVMLLIMGVGFALGAGAANLDLSNANIPGGVGVSPGWAGTMPYLFTGAGLLWLLATTLSGAFAGGLVGGLLERRWFSRTRTYERERRATRRVTRY